MRVFGRLTRRFARAARALPLIVAAGLPFQAHAEDAVLDVNASLLDAIRNTLGNPDNASRDIALTDVAVFDAVNAATGLRYKSYAYSGGAVLNASPDAAALAAGYGVMLSLFPSQSATLNAAYQAQLAALGVGPAIAKGVTLGAGQAAAMLASRAGDGASSAGTPGSAVLGASTNYYTIHPANGNPSIYQYTVNAPAGAAQNPGKPLNSGWGNVAPFTMTTSTQFLSNIPAHLQTPALGTARYSADLAYVEAVGGTNSTLRTAAETDMARFWANATKTWTPPGEMLNLADVVARNNHLTALQTARLSALVGVSLADAGIAAWQEKYTANTARPITEIQLSTDPSIADPSWQSLWNAPNFPSYMSGHSAFSGAAAAALAAFFGTDKMTFCIGADPNAASLPDASGATGFINAADATECFTSFKAAADAAGMSRIYGGIHTMTDNLAGLYVGAEIGWQAYRVFATPVPELPSAALFGLGAAGVLLAGRYRKSDGPYRPGAA